MRSILNIRIAFCTAFRFFQSQGLNKYKFNLFVYVQDAISVKEFCNHPTKAVNLCFLR